MLSSLILKKWTKKEKKKGALKWGHFARTLALHYQVFMLLVGMRANKLDIEKSKWEGTTPSGLQAITSLMGVQAPKLDIEKSKWEGMTPSGLQAFTLLMGL